MDAATRATVLCCRVGSELDAFVAAVKRLVAVRTSGTEAEVADALGAAQVAGHAVTETVSEVVRAEVWTEAGREPSRPCAKRSAVWR